MSDETKTNGTNGIDFKEWAILELMGHVKLGGIVTEVEMFGAKLGRIEVPTATGFVTQFFGGGSVYRLTPTTEAIARLVAQSNAPAPINRWELPQLAAASGAPDPRGDDEDDRDDEDNDI